MDSRNQGIADHPAANKRTYSWSIIGDFTLYLKYRETSESDYHVGQKFVRPTLRRFTPRFNYGRW